MFLEKLRDIYKEKDYLRDSLSWEEFYPCLRRFLLSEISSGAQYVNPYTFSASYGFDTTKSIKIFLSLADDQGIFKIIYIYTCPFCDEIEIFSNKDKIRNLTCQHCGRTAPIHDDYSLNVNILFELWPSELREMRDYLKARPSFDKEKRISGEGKSDNKGVSLKDALASNKFKRDSSPLNKDLQSISNQLCTLLDQGLRNA